MKATKLGRVNTIFKVDKYEYHVNLNNVYYVKDMKQNLISYARVTVKNKIISYDNTCEIYNPFEQLIATARKVNNIYRMTSFIKRKVKEVNSGQLPIRQITEKEKWHRTFGHVNFQYLSTLSKNELLIGLPKDLEKEEMKCVTCIESKMHNLPFENNRKRAKEILQIIHTDLNGPHPTIGKGGEKYFLSFVDDYSKLAKVCCIKSKADVHTCFVEYINQVENMTGKRVKNVRCDNGKEYINKEIFKFAREKGIRIAPCPPHVHELNGVAERFNRTIMDSARCLLKEAKVNTIFWPEVIKTAAYLKNRTLANTVELKIPYEIFFNEKPDVRHLRLYGSRVFIRIPESQRKSKWDDKAKLGVLLGYADVGYRILINNRVIVARHVDIINNANQYIGLRNNDEQHDENSNIHEETSMKIENASFNGSEKPGVEDKQFNDENDSESDDESMETSRVQNKLSVETPLRRSGRERKPNPKYAEKTLTIVFM